jgi:S-adenosylmethionine decarboxylase
MKSAGTHLIIDGYVRDASVFEATRLESMFRRLVSALDMQILSGPTFVEVPLDESKLGGGTFQDEGGITGSCIISTSHIAIHCWPLRHFFSMDVFSCKDFNTTRALSIIHEALDLSANVNITNLNRVDPGCQGT